MIYVRELASTSAPSGVAVSVVTSHLGVLVGRRRDGNPTWTFVGGKIEPGESPEDAAVRETLEETGLRTRATGVIGSRVHPRTGVRVVYVAAVPVDDRDAVTARPEELSEARWASLGEVTGLMGEMSYPARQHMTRVLGML
jgi:8-oxo-dGTP diphosphatase